MILNLIWKEAREHLWKLVALSAMVISPLLVLDLLQHTSWGRFGLTDISSFIICVAAFISPIWIASWTVASEKSSRTLSTLLVLPVNRYLPFIIKVAFGTLTLIIPLAIGLYLSKGLNSDMFVADSPWGDAHFFPALFASAISLYFMILALTMSVRRESSVAMVGVLIVAFCYLWLFIAADAFDDKYVGSFIMGGNPLLILWIADRYFAQDAGYLIELHFLGTALWFFIAAARFGKSSFSSSRAELPATPSIRIPSITPMHHPRFALFWKEWTEQRWTIVCCFLAGVFLAILIGVLAASQNPRENTVFEILRHTAENLSVLALFISCIAAVVLGVGSYTTDLDPALVNFWHGLPIPIPRWFRTKYLVSLLGLCALLIAQIAIAYLITFTVPVTMDYTLYTSNEDMLREQVLQTLLGGLILLPLVHAFAIFFAALIRRPIYAAILAIIFSITLVLLPISKDTQVAQVLFTTGPGYYPLLFTMLILISVFATLAFLLTSRHALIKNWHLA